MANKNLTDLTARTATADSDLIHVNSGGVDYKETKVNFLQGDFNHVFANNSLLTTQVNSLPIGTYIGKIASYTHQSETGVPVNDNFYVYAHVYSSADAYVSIRRTYGDEEYIAVKSGGTWGSWAKTPNRAEITSLNNSLANSCLRKADHYFSGSFTVNSSGYVLLGSIPSSFGVTISDFYVTFLIRGWSGGSGALSLVVGSNGTDLYLTSAPGTTVTGITVRLWYIKSVLA